METENQITLPVSNLTGEVLLFYEKWFYSLYDNLSKMEKRKEGDLLDEETVKRYFIGNLLHWFQSSICNSNEVFEKVAKDLKATLGKDYDYTVEELEYMVYVAKTFPDLRKDGVFIIFAFAANSKERVEEFTSLMK